MSDKETELTPISRMFRTFYDVKADLDTLTGLLDGELAYATDEAILYRQWGNGAANWLAVSSNSFAGMPDIQFVRKTADETVNNSIALQNDDELEFAVAANEVWLVIFYIIFNSAADADFKQGYTVPGGGNGRGFYNAIDVNDAFGGGEFSVGQTVNVGGTAADVMRAYIQTIIYNGGMAGVIHYQWAQATQRVSDTIVRENSCLIAIRIA